MREITAEAITAAVRDLCVDANRVLPADLEALIQQRAQEEVRPLSHAQRPHRRPQVHCVNLHRHIAPEERAAGLPGYRHGRYLCRGGPGRPHLRGL